MAIRHNYGIDYNSTRIIVVYATITLGLIHGLKYGMTRTLESVVNFIQRGAPCTTLSTTVNYSEGCAIKTLLSIKF